jgi:hypothetical protein
MDWRRELLGQSHRVGFWSIFWRMLSRPNH